MRSRLKSLMDTLTPSQRSERMSRIRSKDTKPELAVRSITHALGYRYRLHAAKLPGKPDLVFPSRKKVIFVHGCFWHAHDNCSVANQPKSRSLFWAQKFARNKERDGINNFQLNALGWKTMTIWECEVRDAQKLARRVAKFLGPLRNRSRKVGRDGRR